MEIVPFLLKVELLYHSVPSFPGHLPVPIADFYSKKHHYVFWIKKIPPIRGGKSL